MGDLADDTYDAAMRTYERQSDVKVSMKKVCPNNKDRPCNWIVEKEFGLLECLTCGALLDE